MDDLMSRDRLVAPNGKHLDLYNDEAEAWRLAHQLDGEPAVLYVDAARATRFGGRYFRNSRTGTFHAHRIQIRDILNLQANFAHQYSAGGVPLRWENGVPMLLLCKVKRRSGVTWEVAKGKLEPCETPEQAAIREVHEELGFSLPLYTREHVGDIRYGFIAPGGLPRLKTVHMYLLESHESWEGSNLSQPRPRASWTCDGSRRLRQRAWFDTRASFRLCVGSETFSSAPSFHDQSES